MLSSRERPPLTSEIPEDATPADPADAEADYDAFVRKHLRRNYLGHYLHGMLGMTGFRVLAAPTLLPAFLATLAPAASASAFVGLGLALQQAGQIISPVIGANLVEHRKRVLPAATLMGSLMRAAILLLAVAAWFLDGKTLAVVVLALLFAYGFFQGAQRVVFQLLLAKAIPIERRGRLQAYRNMTGGAIAAVLSWFAGRFLIQHNVLGNGYAVTFLIVFVLTSLGLTALRLLMIEPEPPALRPRTRLRERLKDFDGLIHADPNYRNFLVAQALAVGGRMAAPLYVLHAAQRVGLTGASLGLFSLVYLGADTASNLAWGHRGDRGGFRSNFVGAMALGALGLGAMIFAHSEPVFLLAFVALGASNAGYQMSAQTLILEFGARQDIAMRLGISATIEGVVSSAAPLIGGLIGVAVGYPPAFAIAMGLQLASLIVLLMGVREPRSLKAVS